MQLPTLSALAIPGVLVLISFLSYSSQLLFLYIEPGPLESGQSWKFNILLICLLVSYYRAIVTDPGRIPRGWTDGSGDSTEDLKDDAGALDSHEQRKRWCRKCEAAKPPRAHHCKVCKRCIPKMDHHCPWTANCVSQLTFPHFIRFLFYAVTAMTYLQYFIYVRGRVIWDNRHFPSYHGPSHFEIVHLFVLFIVNSLTLFALAILLIRTIWSLSVNTTTIEGWEIERHETLLRRARYMSGYLNGPDGQRIRIVRQEFPYDIGIWQNIKQAMNTGNILAWFWPLSATPAIETGLDYEVNGFEDPSVTWPPPDPDRMPRIRRSFNPEEAFIFNSAVGDEERMRAFTQRQQADLIRQTGDGVYVQRRRPFHQRFSETGDEIIEDSDGESEHDVEDEDEDEDEGEEGWRNAEGERLGDFGVDEDVEFYDEDVPLAELLKTKRLGNRSG